jgi:hypothetical protein
MALNSSNVFEDSRNLVDKALALGESFASIATLTHVTDSAVRTWRKRNRAKLSAIQPLIDLVEGKEKGLSPDQSGESLKDTHKLLTKLMDVMTDKIEKYLSGERDKPPIDDANFILMYQNIIKENIL